MKKSFPLSRAYQLIEPGPVVMVSTHYRGKSNIMTMSWHTVMEFEPPLIGCVISNRNYTFKMIKKSKECVINIPTVALAPVIVQVGNSSGAKIDKFQQFNLTQEFGSMVDVPMITECYANLECKVVNMRWVPTYNFFVLEVLSAWVDTSKKRQRTIHHCGRGVFVVDGKIIRFPSKKK